MNSITAAKRISRLVVILTIYAIILYAVPQVFANGKSIKVQWKRPTNPPICLTMSTGGRYFGVVDKNGEVRFYDRRGHLIWAKRIEGATDVMIAKNGQSLLVYSRLNPVYKHVYFFRHDGSLLWKHRVEGSVWSGDVSPDGTHAAVTTGERFIYLYTPDPKYPKYRRWRLNGIGYCVTFTPDGERVIVGNWQDSELACYDIQGEFQWRSEYGNDNQYQIQISGDGNRILGLLSATNHDPGLEVRLWESGGNLLWKRSLDGFDACAYISPQSRYVAISYANYLPKEGSDIIERKVAVYKFNGQLLWEKGGLFFGPRLIALSPGGTSVLVSDGDKCIYNIDERGKILSKLTLGGKIRNAISSDSGHSILVYCGDGWLYLMSIV